MRISVNSSSIENEYFTPVIFVANKTGAAAGVGLDLIAAICWKFDS
jgi:hypothetical protein